jgi:hypothetical protein
MVRLAGTDAEPLVATVAVLEPWKLDEELEALVAEMPQQPELKQLSEARQEWLARRGRSES